jgi:pyruvate/2-oxoglutarate dehydrogenase complex dihydrolipoamide dehydrogenase (E3) component
VPIPRIHPRDEYNETLLANVHPPDWKNPEPTGRYNLVVIGAGSAGLITAAVAAGLGARVALVERHLLGGDCLNVGCVPSKGLIRASRMVAESRRAAAEIGLPEPVGIDFGAAMRRVRRVRATISLEDSARRYRDELGVEVFLGDARFSGGDAVEVDGKTLRFKKAVIATGARPVAPPLPGLADAGFLTNETLFELTESPGRLGVIGAGPIGCEMAQAFQRLGSRVVLFDLAPQVLPRESPEAAAIVERRFREEGIELLLGCRLERVENRGAARIIHVACAGGAPRQVEVDRILVGVGRAPNVEGLGLEAVGVEFDAHRGVVVDEHLRTSNRRIYAAGDVAMRWKFTHAADAAAKIVVQNALFPFLPKKKLSSLVMPWCTYTDPEVAHVGLYPQEARAQGIEIDSFRVSMSEVNRAVADGEDEGFVEVHVKKGSDRILGATIVAAHAGEMISEVTLAIVGGLGMKTLLQVIHPYPTQAEGIKRTAGAWTRARLTPTARGILGRLMALQR